MQFLNILKNINYIFKKLRILNDIKKKYIYFVFKNAEIYVMFIFKM